MNRKGYWVIEGMIAVVMIAIVGSLLFGKFKGPAPVVVKGDSHCWTPQPGIFYTYTYGILGDHPHHYLLKRCRWETYGGLANATPVLSDIDTIRVDSVEYYQYRGLQP